MNSPVISLYWILDLTCLPFKHDIGVLSSLKSALAAQGVQLSSRPVPEIRIKALDGSQNTPRLLYVQVCIITSQNVHNTLITA